MPKDQHRADAFQPAHAAEHQEAVRACELLELKGNAVGVMVEVTHAGHVDVDDDDLAGGRTRSSVLEAAFDATMEELVRLGATDPSVTGAVATGDMEITVTVEAASPSEAVAKADAIIRAALHAAGLATPEWDGPRPPASVVWGHVAVDAVPAP